MKQHLSILLCLISALAQADNFTAPDTRPTITHSLKLQKYVRTIANYQPETTALKKRLLKTIAYYKKIHILKTVNKINYTVDCIPFGEQPALIDNRSLVETMLPAVRTMTENNLDALTKMGENLEFNAASQCPIGSVALLRPSKRVLTSERANKKAAPERRVTHFSGGYSYELGEDNAGQAVSILTDASQAYFKGPQQQFVKSNNFDDHSLDQFWFTNRTYQQSIPTYSVEFGIIASAYFTANASTSIFVFASVDNYGNNSCYNNECPNFVQFPNTPVLGSPTNTGLDYIFHVTHTTLNQYLNSPAYYLTLVTHDASTHNSAGSTSVLLGYYADSIYPSNSDLPKYFSAGAEVYARAHDDGTLMYGNYMTPYVGYNGPLKIQFSTENDNHFPYYTSNGPAPYGLIWHLGQDKPV